MLNKLAKRMQSLSVWQTALIGLAILIVVVLIITGSQQSTPAGASEGLGSRSLAVLTLLAFLAGVFSFVSPCTLPILPAYFAFATQSGRSRIAVNTVAFMFGVALMFSLLGASASALGRLVIQSQELLLLFGGAIVMIFGVMSLLGKGFTGFSRQQSATTDSGTRSSFVFGLTFSLGWSSCVGPILGVILTLAASTGNVGRGMLLLFVYALGLGLPLILVSTFFGQASRNSLFWRLLRGKGWVWNTHQIVVSTVWALAIWRVLASLSRYAFENVGTFAGQQFTLAHEVGILAIALLGAVLWTFSNPGERRTALQLHSTQLASGALFVLMAVLMLNGTLAEFNALIPADVAIWFSGVEDQLVGLFS